MKQRASYIGVLIGTALIALVLIGSYQTVNAEEVSFARGQKLNHMLSVCLDKKDAVAILDADEKDGFAAAGVIWEKAEKCQTVPVMGPTVGKVVKTAQVKRGDRTVTARVVEILNGEEVIGYFFTTATVDERNS